MSADMVREAFARGASGYVLKVDAGTELLMAVEAVLRGERFVGRRFSGLVLPAARLPQAEGSGRHQVGFYSDDRVLLEALTQFVGTALRLGNAAIVLATESHRDGLLVRLQKYGLDINAAVEHGKCTALDAAGALATVLVDDKIDAVRFFAVFDDLIQKAAEAAGGQSRFAIFGECVHLLWTQGNADAAIQMEKLGNQLAQRYEVDILCGYSLKGFKGGVGSLIFEKICAEHSAVHTR